LQGFALGRAARLGADRGAALAGILRQLGITGLGGGLLCRPSLGLVLVIGGLVVPITGLQVLAGCGALVPALGTLGRVALRLPVGVVGLDRLGCLLPWRLPLA